MAPGEIPVVLTELVVPVVLVLVGGEDTLPLLLGTLADRLEIEGGLVRIDVAVRPDLLRLRAIPLRGFEQVPVQLVLLLLKQVETLALIDDLPLIADDFL